MTSDSRATAVIVPDVERREPTPREQATCSYRASRAAAVEPHHYPHASFVGQVLEGRTLSEAMDLVKWIGRTLDAIATEEQP